MDQSRLVKRNNSSSSVVEKHEIEADRDVAHKSTQPSAAPPVPARLVVRQSSTAEKFDVEQSEKDAKPSPSGTGQQSSAAPTVTKTPVVAIPKIGASSVFKEVPRGKDTKNGPLPLSTSQPADARPPFGPLPPAPAANRSEPHTIPVKIIATNEAADRQKPDTSVHEPARLPEFVDWSARTTSALYKQLEEEVARLRCDKKQLQERLDRSLQQTDIDRQVIRGLQLDVRQLRDKLYEAERQIRIAKSNDEEDAQKKARGSRWAESDRSGVYAGSSAAAGSSSTSANRYANNASETIAKQREQKLLQVQMENDVLKRKIEELDDSIRRNDRQMKSLKDENQDLRSRLEGDSKRFAKFEDRVKQLETALTKANHDNLQLIDQMRSQLFAQQSKRNEPSSTTSSASASSAVRTPLARNTLTENTTSLSHAAASNSASHTTRVTDTIRQPASSTLLSSRDPDSSHASVRQHLTRASEKENPSAIGVSSAAVPIASSTAASASASNQAHSSHLGTHAHQPSSQFYSISSTSTLGLRRYLSLPPTARRQLTSRYVSRVQEAPSALLDSARLDSATSQSVLNTPRSVKDNNAGLVSLSLLRTPNTSKQDVGAAQDHSTGAFNRTPSGTRGSSTTNSGLLYSSTSKANSSQQQYDTLTRGSLSARSSKPSQINDSALTGLASSSASRNDVSSSKQTSSIMSLASSKIPAAQSTPEQAANTRINLQEYRDYLKERRRMLVERGGEHYPAPELPAEAV